jgi:PIN domain nuclease of toxin-antitoxin system
VKLLLDTHVFIWALTSPERLGKSTRHSFLNVDTEIYVSSVSALEIARLASLRQLEITGPVDLWIERGRHDLGVATVPIDDRIAVEAYALPGAFHADPADRLLVATARILGFQLTTADERILAYTHVRRSDARK